MKTAITLMTGMLLLAWHMTAPAAPNDHCQGSKIRKTFESGARWDMCWTIAPGQGLTLSQVHYKAPGSVQRRVLGEAALSQIQADFDDGAIDSVFVSTQMGLGGDNTQTLTQQHCAGGELHAENGRNVLCARTRRKSYLYKYTAQRQTSAFEISSQAQLGPRNYQLRWTFYENGTIEPAVGLSGILPAVGESAEQYGWPVGQAQAIATGFTDHYLWRLDFDLATTPDNDRVEEISSIPTANRLRKRKVISTLATEAAKSLNPNHKTFWRVLDGSARTTTGIGNISYELVPAHYDQSAINSRNQDWLKHDVFFTVYNACERHAANNSASHCAQHVANYTANNQPLTNKDVVVWYKQSNHYLPRSEDSNRLITRWNSFKLFPRDWTANNPF